MPESPPAQHNPAAIEMRGIVKRFPGVVANNGIELSVTRGEIHGLLGENGAGKSTLMNILFGLYHPDEGEIRVNGQRVTFHNARDAVLAGLAMVHQHFMLIPRFTVTENVILGSEGASPVLDRKAAGERVAEIGAQYGLNVDPNATVGTLPVGMQQRVEILRALYQGGSTLILDEPTALLTPQEVEELYEVLDRLRASGSTIIFITHKLREIAAVTDRVTVIHRGKTVGTRPTAGSTAAELAELMVGRAVSLQVDRPPAHPGEPVLTAHDLRVRGSQGQASLDGVDVTLRRGEILGVCGVEGNGQAELIEVLAGLRQPDSGTVTLKGQDVTATGPNPRREMGLSYIPEDRHGRGLVLPFSLTENVLLGNADVAPFSTGGRIDYGGARELTDRLMREFDVRAPSPETAAGALSGGNQQKLIIARELHREPDALLAIQPTRGLDVGAIEFVHKQLVAERDKGRGVLLLSFDLDEILDLSDRILVLCGGRIVGDFANGEVSRTDLGLLMGGRRLDEHASAAS
ncbi:MAG: ABC transporter ATP-binding protein [Thermomicrobiales bacterium]